MFSVIKASISVSVWWVQRYPEAPVSSGNVCRYHAAGPMACSMSWRCRMAPSEGGYAARLYILADETNDFIHRCARQEHGGHTGLLQTRDVLVRNDAADY